MSASATGQGNSATGWHAGLRESALFDRGVIAEIQRARAKGCTTSAASAQTSRPAF